MEQALVSLSPLRQAIVVEALRWEGTPYQHRQHCRGAGADCIGFPFGVSLACGLLPPTAQVPYYNTQWHVHQRYELLVETVVSFGCREKTLDTLLPGDLILFRLGWVCSHAGLLINPTHFMHAVCPYPHKVLTRPFDGAWRRKLAKRFFALPTVDD